MPRNKRQQHSNLSRTTTVKRLIAFPFLFPFPVSISSFHFISISCFSIARTRHAGHAREKPHLPICACIIGDLELIITKN